MALNSGLKLKWQQQIKSDKAAFGRKMRATTPIEPKYRIKNPSNGKVLRGEYTMKQVLSIMNDNGASLADYTLLQA